MGRCVFCRADTWVYSEQHTPSLLWECANCGPVKMSHQWEIWFESAESVSADDRGPIASWLTHRHLTDTTDRRRLWPSYEDDLGDSLKGICEGTSDTRKKLAALGRLVSEYDEQHS